MYIFPNAKRGFSTFLEGSRCCVLQWCSGRFSELSKSNPEFLEFVEFLEFAEFLEFVEILGVRADFSGSAVKAGL